jgi:hypothetical protein
MAGSITEEDKKFLEEWESISNQGWGILRLDPRGEEKDEVILGRRHFKLTTEERIITQDKIKDRKNDPFLNGAFRPVIVPDSVTVESNPNALSDEEILKILNTGSEIAWEEWLNTITSVATVRRMIELAEETEISIKRYRRLESRLEEVRGEVRISSNDPALQSFLSDRPNLGATNNTVTNGTGNPRRQSGRSENYR